MKKSSFKITSAKFGDMFFGVPANFDGSPYQKSYEVLTGFDTFEQAEDVAKEFKLQVVLLSKKNGQDVWTVEGERSEPLSPKDMYRGEICVSWKKGEDTVGSIVSEYRELWEDLDDDEAAPLVTRCAETIREFQKLKDDEWLCKDSNGDVFVCADKAMECNNGDDESYIIGVADYDSLLGIADNETEE